jgi:hypothetical protein
MKMSQEERQSELREKTRQLLAGPLKHARVVALAAALLPVAAVPAAAQVEDPTACPSGGNWVCGFAWKDDGDGIRQDDEPIFANATVIVDGSDTPAGMTNDYGFYKLFLESGDHDIAIVAPNGTTAAPQDQGVDDTVDSDGELIGANSVAHVSVVPGVDTSHVDFGFVGASNIGTGTPGYWANHPEAWPDSVVVGGIPYTSATGIPLIKAPDSKDKTLTLFASLIAAKLNLMNGTNGACINATITDADKWLMTYPVGSGVRASSYAWKVGEPFHRMMDNYNNGGLCAPHRD